MAVRNRDSWEFVTRPNASAVVGIAALTEAGELLLVEQFRRPLNKNVIELPAGLVGDDPGTAHEPPIEAAKRELLEETGYEAEQWRELMTGPSSAGLTDECVVLFSALRAKKTEAGGGVAGENIIVHTVPLDQVDSWLKSKETEGAAIDFKILAGLYFLRRERGNLA